MRRMLAMLLAAPVAAIGLCSETASAAPLPPPPTAPVLVLTPPPPAPVPVLPFDPSMLPVRRHPDGRPILVGYGLALR